MNRYPLWKYLLILTLIAFGVIYALPNLYGKAPALQISATRSAEISELTEFQVSNALEEASIKYKAMNLGVENLTIHFDNEETQLQAQSVIKESLGRGYVVALNLAPSTPAWLRKIGAEPMFLGLDLRGGVHFLMEVDMDAAIAKAEERFISDLRSDMRENKIRYRTITNGREGGVLLRFREVTDRDNGLSLIQDSYAELDVSVPETASGEPQLLATIKEEVLLETRKLALQQNMTTLRKRVNEIGVAEPVIQQQGLNRIVVQLPGVQDTSRAKEILGATATLEFRLVDEKHNPQDAVDGRVPAGSKLYQERSGLPILLKKQILLAGDAIINAASGFDSLSGSPNVSITLDGKGAKRMSYGTRDNVGKRLAVVFIENKVEFLKENGQLVEKKEIIEEVINAATIREQLGKHFQITGLDSAQEARTLALLLRAGALAAPIYIVEERTVGQAWARIILIRVLIR